ncbi:hypothetical protein KY361_04820 [Candidatus Woesearchaeota archaeon]|nr:hypothetical protein [Candidatus Woesearchaeota archaeon]
MERALLGDVHPNHHFIAKNGARIRNIRELYNSVKGMDDITFNHHVNDFKNDFHNWVRDIHKDNELAKSLLEARTKKEMAELLKARIEELERVRKEVKAIEAKPAKKAPARKARKRKTAKAEKTPAQPEPEEEGADSGEEIKEEETAPDVDIIEAPEIVDEGKTLLERQVFRNITVGDFALGLIIGAIAGLVLSRII